VGLIVGSLEGEGVFVVLIEYNLESVMDGVNDNVDRLDDNVNDCESEVEGVSAIEYDLDRLFVAEGVVVNDADTWLERVNVKLLCVSEYVTVLVVDDVMVLVLKALGVIDVVGDAVTVERNDDVAVMEPVAENRKEWELVLEMEEENDADQLAVFEITDERVGEMVDWVNETECDGD
jgi:virulence-associated protein VagC